MKRINSESTILGITGYTEHDAVITMFPIPFSEYRKAEPKVLPVYSKENNCLFLLPDAGAAPYSNSTIDKKREIMYNNSQKELKNMIPVEIRKLIIKNREEGVKVSEISRILKVSESAIYSICRKYEERKHLNGNYPGRKPKITEEQKKAVIKLVEERPDITLKEIIEELKLPIKKSRVSKILLNEKMFFKKETGTRK